jgi:hypothetical protein
MSFTGYVKLDGTLVGTFLIVNTSNTPLNADSLPTFRVYGPNGYIENGTAALKDSGTVTGATNASPIVITSSAHGLTTGSYLTLASVAGNTAANGSFVITRVNANQYSLDGSTGNGSYTSGGTWNAAGLYKVTITCMGVDGYEAGEVYQVHLLYELSSVETSQVINFQVN